MIANQLRKTGRFPAQQRPSAAILKPSNLNELKRILDPLSRTATPIRPRGAGTSSTDCNHSESGTTIDLSGLDRITNIDTYNHAVTVEAGVRIETLVRALAQHGLELQSGCDMQRRSVGGAIAAPCFGPAIGNESGYFSSHVTGLKIVRADGQVMKIGEEQRSLLTAFRSSYGALGIIVEATLDVRPIRTFTASHRRISIDKFSEVVDALANGNVGLKFYLMPYRDRVYLDLRRYESDARNAYKAPWKIKDWGESTVLPQVFKSINKVVPIPSVRYRLIDTISEATQGVVNSRLVKTGSNAQSQSVGPTRSGIASELYSTWCFPATDFSMIIRAYREFCQRTFENSGYRCDLPAVGFRICRDANSLLSPSFDEPMIALTTASTQAAGWDDFVIDLAEFAENWAGIPILSQTRAVRSTYAHQAYADRRDFFSRMRQRLDPNNRFLSPYIAQTLE